MNYYHTIISGLEEQLFKLHPDVKLIYNTINGLKNLVDDPNGILNPNSTLVYSEKMPVSGKIIFALKYTNRMCRMSDIEMVIKKFEPNFKKGLSTPLQKLKKPRAIFSINPTGSNKTVWYGLIGWCGEDGKIKEEYYIK